MKTASYHGILKGQTTVLLESPMPLADGTPVVVTAASPPAGTPAAVLVAMDAEPHLTREAVMELEQAIAAGRRPRGRVEPFPEQAGEEEAV